MSPTSKRVLRVATGVGKFALNGSMQRQKFWQLTSSDGRPEDVYHISRQLYSKDAIQDLFIALRKSRSRLGKTDSIKFYLYKSLKRLIIKESGQWFNQCAEINSEKAFDFTFSHERVLIDRQLDEEKAAALNKALQSLAPRQREIIYYFYYEGMSYQQIQELMGMSHVRSARNLLYKALDFLRQQIK